MLAPQNHLHVLAHALGYAATSPSSWPHGSSVCRRLVRTLGFPRCAGNSSAPTTHGAYSSRRASVQAQILRAASVDDHTSR